MKPYVIQFENGVNVVIIDRTIEQVKQDTYNFAKYGKKIGEEFSCCHNMPYTIREATVEEVQEKKAYKEQVEEEYQEFLQENRKIERYNEALARATCHHEFMNAAKHLL